MRVTLRPAHLEDFDYCAMLYFAGMDGTILAFKLDRSAQLASLRRSWDVTQVRIMTLACNDIGWVQTALQDDALFIGQIFVEPAYQGQGIGSEVMRHLIQEAARDGRAVTLGVVKANPALRLYERLGFRITDEDERKFYMKRGR
jgi:ribosomal protein S18 acetylase RimI-like enzyme